MSREKNLVKIKKPKNKELPFFEPDLDKYFSKIENFSKRFLSII